MKIAGNLGELCRGRGDARLTVPVVVAAAAGVFAYGLGMGGARSWGMGVMVGVKLPPVIFLTLAITALLNGLLAGVLGTGLNFRETLRLSVLPFVLMGLILLGLAPVAWFIAWHAPAAAGAEYKIWHSAFLLLHTACIAAAGILAHRQMLPAVRDAARTAGRGTVIFFVWLAGNLFVGAQVTWIFRPYFGSPGLPVQFLRDHPLTGNFYESVLHSIVVFFNHL